MDLGLKGLKDIVTGGTKGIGQAIAQTLAKEGAHVAICARNADEVAASVAELQGRGVTAFGRQGLGDGLADALGAAGDDGLEALESEIHVGSCVC